MNGGRLRTAVAVLAATGSLVARGSAPTGSASSSSSSSSSPEPSAPSRVASSTPSAVSQTSVTAKPGPTLSDGRPRRATLSIPALGLRDLVVVPYAGRTDDAPGTRIQDRGVAASPHGREGGVGPGGRGNFQVTAHRTSSSRPFARLPELRVGRLAIVLAAGVRYVYEIRRSRITSFRSVRSLAEQRAAVPGQPGAAPTKAFLTLSTCATQEDHARGNYWSDELHNPEHRFDKIGVLVRTELAD